MDVPLRVLIIADAADEAMLLEELRAGGYDPRQQRVKTLAALQAALDRQAWDLVTADPQLPACSIDKVLESLQDKGLDVPLIVLLDHADDMETMNLMHLSVHDYIVRSRPRRLLPVVERRLRDAAGRREREWLLQQLEDAKNRLQILSAGTMDIQEAERRRIARDLHDQIGQALTAVKIHLEAIRRLPGARSVARQLEDCFPVIDGAIQEVRNLCANLRPPQLDDLGLIAALRTLLTEQARLAGWTVHFDTDSPAARWDPRLETVCFRVTQEALTNIARHGHAREVSLELKEAGEELHLTICDDGRGFDLAAARKRAIEGASLGLIGMEERVELAGGRLSWNTAPNEGSELHLVLPLWVRPKHRRRWRDRIEDRLH